jgi:hypothetical protein
MSQLEDIVAWRLERPTIMWRLLIYAHRLLTALFLEFPSGGLGGFVPWAAGLPEDPEEAISTVELFAHGKAPWLSPIAGKTFIEASRTKAWVNYFDSAEHRRYLPLDSLDLVSARPRIRSKRPRFKTAPWEARLTGPDQDVTIKGPWLSIAWLGTLAGWAEPDPP